MRAPHPLHDVTNTVSIGDAGAVAEAIDGILTPRFGRDAFDCALLHAAFADVERIFNGDDPDYLACDMPYHDLRHSLDTALVMARLIDGYQAEHAGRANALGPDQALLGVLLAVFHDCGFIRKAGEADRIGPDFIACHEERGIDFAEAYLRRTALAAYAPLALLIDATRLIADLDLVFADQQNTTVVLGHMLGTADLVSQVSDRYYVERCFFHLYPEFVLGRHDRIRTADGEEQILYRDAFDLLRKTPGFYEQVVNRRLDVDFNRVHGYLARHFGAVDPYAEAVARNIKRLVQVLAEGEDRFLRREPVSTTRQLDPAYRARPARAASA